jgi:hypothetical protein
MPNELTEAERVMKIETQVENLVSVVTRMDAKMDAWQANFVSKELLAVELKARDKEITSLNKKFDDITAEKTTSKNITPLWAAAIIAAVALIISLWPR